MLCIIFFSNTYMIHRSFNVMMDQSNEDQFKAELYKKYDACKKVLIPKDQYISMIEDLKVAASNNQAKSRHGYYLLSK